MDTGKEIDQVDGRFDGPEPLTESSAEDSTDSQSAHSSIAVSVLTADQVLENAPAGMTPASPAEDFSPPPATRDPFESGSDSVDATDPVVEPAVPPSDASGEPAGPTNQEPSPADGPLTPSDSDSGVPEEIPARTSPEPGPDEAVALLATAGRHSEEEEPEEASTEEYAQATKADLVQLLNGLLAEEDSKRVEAALRRIKPRFDQLGEEEKQEARRKFVTEGGAEEAFDYRPDALTQQFEALQRQLREKRSRQLRDLEKSKERNLATKTALLEKLRHLVDSEETQASIDAVKEVQREWKATGAVAPQSGNDLWASYHALLERHYANRSIYYELKELDRRKSLETKLELCEKAEKLALREPSNAVIKEINDLHEEYRHLGPVPKEEQEAVWQRLKVASDTIYARRRQQMEGMRREMEQNYQLKRQLVTALEAFESFDSQKINEWNEKTQAILELQKQWNVIGVVTKERAKEVSRQFWHAFKGFFHRKNEFFKRLEEARSQNLLRKTRLCEQVEALLTTEDVEGAAEEVKKLQQEWKNVGPVPEKQKNPIFDRFKAAGDAFFSRRRDNRSETDKQFEENLLKKMAVCQAIEQLADGRGSEVDQLEALKAQWAGIGFVPRKNMQDIGKRYLEAIHRFARNADKLSGVQKERMKLTAEADVSRGNPTAQRNLQSKEVNLRKRISQLENDISLWKNNIEFFAHSKTADKLRAEFNQKILEAEQELREAKTQVKLIVEMG